MKIYDDGEIIEKSEYRKKKKHRKPTGKTHVIEKWVKKED